MTDESELQMVRVLPSYARDSFPSGAARYNDEREYLAYRYDTTSKDHVWRIVVKESDKRSVGFYRDSSDPPGYVGWSIYDRHLEIIDEDEEEPMPRKEELKRVRLKMNYPDGERPDNQAFPTSDTPEDSLDRVFWGYKTEDDDYIRVVVEGEPGKYPEDERGIGFYKGYQDPEGWVGWNIPPKYAEFVDFGGELDKIDQDQAEEAPTDPLRCQWGALSKNAAHDRCEAESEFMIRFRPLLCGHEDPRGNNQMYCRGHMGARMNHLYRGKTRNCPEECGEQGTLIDTFEGVERL